MSCVGFAQNSTAYLYVFFDETGQLDFTQKASKYYIFTTLWTYDPACIAHDLISVRYEMLKEGYNVPQFHANVNPNPVRVRVFESMNGHSCAKAASIVVQKNKVNPSLREHGKFYSQFMDYVLKFSAKGEGFRNFNQLLLLTDTPPTPVVRKAVKKSVAENLPGYLPPDAKYSFFQHPSMSNSCLQAVDYVGWTIARNWELGNPYWKGKIEHYFDQPELNVLERGTSEYY